MKEQNSDVSVFSACSAFEFGDYDAEKDETGSISALRYPSRAPRHYRAAPFEGAVVRLTRSSLSVYRPSDRIFHCELQWREVREVRRHTSRFEDLLSHDFAFLTDSGILVLEVRDARAAHGMAAALELFGVKRRPSPERCAEPRLPPPCPAPRADALERIRRREEEMREAIFFSPRGRSLSAAHGPRRSGSAVGGNSPFVACSPAPRTVSVASEALPRVSTATWPLKSGVEDILRLLEEEETRAIRALRSQEERVRGIGQQQRLLQQHTGVQQENQQEEKAQKPQGLEKHKEQKVLLSPRSILLHRKYTPPQEEGVQQPKQQGPRQPQKQQVEKSQEELSTLKSKKVQQTVDTDSVAPEWREKPAVVRHLMESAPTPPVTHKIRDEARDAAPPTASVGNKSRPATATPSAAAAAQLDEATERNKVENEKRKADSQRKTAEDKQKMSIGGLSLADALERERHAASANSEKNDTKDDNVTETANESKEEGGRSGVKLGGVMYGNWKELRQKETGKIYYRNIVTKEAVWKAPPEVIDMKRRENEKREEAANGTKDSGGGDSKEAGAKKGALRVSGAWKELCDGKSGRLYYVNGETKQRTWKIEETPFAVE